MTHDQQRAVNAHLLIASSALLDAIRDAGDDPIADELRLALVPLCPLFERLTNA